MCQAKVHVVAAIAMMITLAETIPTRPIDSGFPFLNRVSTDRASRTLLLGLLDEGD